MVAALERTGGHEAVNRNLKRNDAFIVRPLEPVEKSVAECAVKGLRQHAAVDDIVIRTADVDKGRFCRAGFFCTVGKLGDFHQDAVADSGFIGLSSSTQQNLQQAVDALLEGVCCKPHFFKERYNDIRDRKIHDVERSDPHKYLNLSLNIDNNITKLRHELVIFEERQKVRKKIKNRFNRSNKKSILHPVDDGLHQVLPQRNTPFIYFRQLTAGAICRPSLASGKNSILITVTAGIRG